MENFTAIYVYADNTTITLGLPSGGLAIFELYKTTSGTQTFFTKTLHSNKRGTCNVDIA